MSSLTMPDRILPLRSPLGLAQAPRPKPAPRSRRSTGPQELADVCRKVLR